MEIFPLKYGDFSLKIHSGDFSIAILKNFNEDLFIGDFSFDDLKIFNEDLFIGDFSFWRFVHGDFSLKIYFGDWTFEKILMKICSWIFFLEDLFLEIFPLKFWKFLLKICSLENFPFENGDFLLWSQSEEDEDGLELMKIYSWWFFFFFEKLIIWMRTLAGSWCGLLDKSLLNFSQKIISINKGLFHWNELEILTQCP